MAQHTIDVVIKVRDAATNKLGAAEKGIKRVGQAAKTASADFTAFNRTLFTTTAFIGTFTKIFSGIGDAINKAAEVDRVEEQFEKAFGPSGSFFQNIKSFTDNSIDKFEAMKQGISLKALGIVKDSGKLAELMAKAGTSAKLAGLDSAEGISRFSDFLKTGSINQLQYLNLIHKANPALQAQMAILHKAGGVMGGVLSTQAKLAIGTKLLNLATENSLQGQRDLADILKDLSQNFFLLKTEVGTFIGKALSPILDKVGNFSVKLKELFSRLQVNGKELLTLTKNVLIIGGAVTGLIATLGSLRLVYMTLSALGFGGIPLVLTLITGLATAFTDVETIVKSFTEKLKMFGAVIMGAAQLVSSFLFDSDNFSKGIGKMDKQLHDFLKEKGLLELTDDIARVSAVIITFVRDTGQQIVTWVDKLTSPIQKLVEWLGKLFSSDGGPWSRKLVESGNIVRDILVKLTAAAAIFFGGKFLLSKIPGIGKLFGGGGGKGGGPSGSSGDPLYVKISSGISGALEGLLGGKEKDSGKSGGGFLGKLGKGASKLAKKAGWLGMALTAFDAVSTLTEEGDFSDKIPKLVGGMGPAATGALLGSVIPGVGTVAGGLAGAVAGQLGLDKVFENFTNKIVTAITGIKTADQRSTVSVPKMPESEEQKLEILVNKLQELQGEKRTQFKEAVEEALTSASEGAAIITPEEWIRIFKFALDNSENLSKVAKSSNFSANKNVNFNRRLNSGVGY